MTNLEGNGVDVLSSIGKGTSYRYFKAMKLHPILKDIFDNPLEAKKRTCRYEIYKRIDASSYYGYKNDEEVSWRKLSGPWRRIYEVEHRGSGKGSSPYGGLHM
jgi:hypothetical protein